MNQELVVISQTIRSVTGTVGDIVRMRREGRAVSDSRLRRLRDDMRLLEHASHARNVATLTRTHVEEVVATHRLIESMNPGGEAYWMCMEQLRTLSHELDSNLREFSRG